MATITPRRPSMYDKGVKIYDTLLFMRFDTEDWYGEDLPLSHRDVEVWYDGEFQGTFDVHGALAAFAVDRPDFGQMKLYWTNGSVVYCGRPWEDDYPQQVFIAPSGIRSMGFYDDVLIMKHFDGEVSCWHTGDGGVNLPFHLGKNSPYEIQGNIFQIWTGGDKSRLDWYSGGHKSFDTGFVYRWGTWGGGVWAKDGCNIFVFDMGGNQIAKIGGG